MPSFCSARPLGRASLPSDGRRRPPTQLQCAAEHGRRRRGDVRVRRAHGGRQFFCCCAVQGRFVSGGFWDRPVASVEIPPQRRPRWASVETITRGRDLRWDYEHLVSSASHEPEVLSTRHVLADGPRIGYIFDGARDRGLPRGEAGCSRSGQCEERDRSASWHH